MVEVSNLVVIVSIILSIAVAVTLYILKFESDRMVCGLVGNEKKFFRKIRIINVILLFIFICLNVISILFTTNGEDLISLLIYIVDGIMYFFLLILFLSRSNQFEKMNTLIVTFLIMIFTFLSMVFGTNLNSLAFSKIDVKDCDILDSEISHFVKIEKADRCIKYKDINGNVKTTSKPATLVYCYDSTNSDNSGRYYYFSKTYDEFMDISADDVKLEFKDIEQPYYSTTHKLYKYNLNGSSMIYIYINRFEEAIVVPEDQVVKIDLSKNT